MGVEIDTIIEPELDRDQESFLRNLAKQVVIATLKAEGFNADDAEVSVLFTDDAFIRELNQQWRGIDEPTDVLSFPMMDPDSDVDRTKVPGIPDVLGDIVISLETARRQAEIANKTLRQEIELLLVHGMLHLLGYDHAEPDEEAAMWKKQDAILNVLAHSPEA